MRVSYCCLLGLVLTGCIIEAPSGEPAAERARASVRDVPTLSHPLNARFANQVEVLGANLLPPHFQPGGQTRVSLFLKVLAPLDRDYTLFVHAESPAGDNRWLFDHAPTGGYRTSQWRRGETLKDEFTVSIPASYTGGSVKLWFGFWDAKADSRLPVADSASVVSDGKHRVLLAEVPVAR
jgi:hypothetical protein